MHRAGAGAGTSLLRRFVFGAAVAAIQVNNPTVVLHLPATVSPGERVTFRLRVSNPGGRALDVYLRGRQPTFDVRITTARGDTVWHRLEGAVIPATVQLRALAPGTSFEISATWDQRTARGAALAPGTYTARAALLLETSELSAAPVNFTVAPR